MIDRVFDIDVKLSKNTNYDIGFFASGYEQRCIYAAKQFNPQMLKRIVVLGFEDISEDNERLQHDLFFKEYMGSDPIILKSSESEPVYNTLIDYFGNRDDTIKILVDYSSMSRLWYAGILNWARYSSKAKKVIIDFVYSCGKYEETVLPMVIKDMLSIPGCEGRLIGKGKSAAIFGLGFYGYATLCILERIEADDLYAYFARHPVMRSYSKRVKGNNESVIVNIPEGNLKELPLGSVEFCFRHLIELASKYLKDNKITLVPMGPKPHVLASILVAMRFKEIGCLRVSARRTRPEKVVPSGEIFGTRVEIIND